MNELHGNSARDVFDLTGRVAIITGGAGHISAVPRRSERGDEDS